MLALLGAAAAGAESRDPAVPAPSSFDYLYIRAHEGNGSGGHAAIRFGSAVFDFQHEDGLVVPRRDDARRFQHLYRTLENRGIERSRIAASTETTELLRTTFERRLLAESRQIELAAELSRDVTLLTAFAVGAPVTLPVRGAGFFAVADDGAGDGVLSELREQIAARHGPDWLAQRAGAAQRASSGGSLLPPAIDPHEIDALHYPAVAETLSRRIEHALAASEAVALLAEPHALCPNRLTDGADLPLDAASHARLREVRATLLAATVRLAASPRPDWGEAFLLSAARLAALDASLASGRLVVLDALPATARRLPITARRRALLPALLAEARDDLTSALGDFFSPSDPSTAAQAELEAAASRVAELRAALAGAPELRVATGNLLPEGSAPVALDPPRSADRATVLRALAATRDAERVYRSRLEERYGYDLVRRNCVTEIFHTVDLALGSQGRDEAADTLRSLREESERRLGGFVDPAAGANFIPFVSSRSVRVEWPVVEREHLRSAREHAVARDGSFGAALRESNVLTSTFYEPSDTAGFFVFFTDSPWPLRPLLGALNLAAALVRSGVGLATLPFDRGDGLRRGLDGALWSVPDLVFANVRKGTSDYVAPGLRPPADLD